MAINSYIPVSNATASAGNYTAVCVNSITSPFNISSYVLTATTGTASFAWNGALVQGSHLYDSFLGSQAMATLYTNYKVKAYRLTVTVSPAASGDTTELVVFPVGNEDIPSSSAGSVDLRVMASQPRSKTAICCFGAMQKANTVVLQQSVHHLLGIGSGQWEMYPPTPFNSAPESSAGGQPSLRGFVGVYIQQLNGSPNTAVLPVRFQLEQLVEFTDLVQQVI